MSTPIERKEVLDALEDEFRRDLAVHLYSAVLLRRIDPTFPPNNWACWPLPLNLVPKPQTTNKYVDTVVGNDEFVTDIDVDYEKIKAARLASARHYIDNYVHFGRGIDRRSVWLKRKRDSDDEGKPVKGKSKGRVSSGSEEESSESETERNALHEQDHDEDEDEDSHDDDENQGETIFPIQLDNLKLHNVSDDKILELLTRDGDGTTFKQIQRVTFKQKDTNSKSDLVNEISALIEKKITEKARKIQASGAIVNESEVTVEIPNQVTIDMSKQIARKVDGLLNALSNKFRRLDKDRAIVNKLSWQHLLLSGLTAMESPYTSYKPEPFMKLYEKCEKLFDQIDYKYEYEEEDVRSTPEATSQTVDSGSDSASASGSASGSEDTDESDSSEAESSSEADSSSEEVEQKTVISVSDSDDSDSDSSNDSSDDSQYESAKESLDGESKTNKESSSENDESESESESASESESDSLPYATDQPVGKGFDVVRYLHGLRNRTYIYKDLSKTYLQRRAFERRRNHDLKLIFMNRLRIQKSYINLHYYSDEKLAHKSIHSNIDYDNIDLSKLRATALFHGQMSLDANHYYIDNGMK